MAIVDYKELVAWQRAMDLVVEVYSASRRFPREEIYGLTNQVRRAAVSVPSNIAEGQGRGAANDFARCLRIANGSRQEVETQIIVAQRLGYLDEETCAKPLSLCVEAGRLISGLLRSLQGV
jgi:four helix bundle protein